MASDELISFKTYQQNPDLVNHVQNYYFKLILDDNFDTYRYPEEDICLFRNVPIDRLVLVVIRYNDWEYLTIEIDNCLKYFLTKNNQFFNQYIEKFTKNYYKLIKLTFNPKDSCDSMIQKCNLTRFRVNKEYNERDLVFYFGWIEFIGPIISFPIISFFGFTLNLLTVLVIRSKKSAEFFTAKTGRINEYIVYNALFNMIECLLSVFTLMSECLGEGSYYCSRLMHLLYVQQFKIYAISYVGEIMKTCSLLTMLAFSLERYIVTSDNQRWLLLKFKTANIKLIIFVILVFGSLSSVIKIFEFANNYARFQVEYPRLALYDLFNHSNQLRRIFLKMLFLFHYVTNDLVLLLANLFVDLLLVIRVRKDLKEKKRKAKSMMMSSKTKQRKRAKDQSKKSKEITKTISNSNKMIIATAIVYTFCRLPELIFNLWLYMQNVSILCESEYCPFILNAIQFMYNISYVTNIFFYLKFYKPFQKAIRNFLKKSK